MTSEADTCRTYVLPKLYEAGWSDDQIREQVTFTDGRIVVAGSRAARRGQKRADYVLRYGRDFPIAVVEAKAEYRHAADGLQQAKSYAEMLGLQFAFATNGAEIIEHDYILGRTHETEAFPRPEELWGRFCGSQELAEDAAKRLLTPAYPGKSLRYYQEIAINRAVQAILQGKPRLLLTLATGTGKTLIAAQVCWKLWSARWNRTGRAGRKPKMLFLADRNILVDDPYSREFAVFGDARHKIQHEVNTSREMYFALYQAMEETGWRPGLYRQYPPDFFDLIVVDECHRGSASEESSWREILEYFEPAVQLGMTATPLREDNRDTYAYFGNPLYVYSLKQGIEDGFLAPYRVHRIVSEWDVNGFRPDPGTLDRYRREIPDRVFGPEEFERVIALKARTRAIARHLTEFLIKNGDRFAKTIVFCVDQDHAAEMLVALSELNADLVKEHPDYAVRITAAEGDIGRGHLDRFKDVETLTPALATTSQLLTTGVDIPTCRNVAIVRTVNSMTEFKQIIGRGTRVRDDYGKLWFNILDYTGSAVARFADPDFDGEPALATQAEIDQAGNVKPGSEQILHPEQAIPDEEVPAIAETGVRPLKVDDWGSEPRKYFYDDGQVEIVANLVYDLDPDGNRLRVIRYTEYAAQVVRQMVTSAAHLRSKWSHAEQRAAVIDALEGRGVSFDHLAAVTNQPDADPFDLLCHVAFQAPLRTRRERSDRVKKEARQFFEKFTPEARQILHEILDKYVEHGMAQFRMPEILKVPPILRHGNPMEIAGKFGGPKRLRGALETMQTMLYAA